MKVTGDAENTTAAISEISRLSTKMETSMKPSTNVTSTGSNFSPPLTSSRVTPIVHPPPPPTKDRNYSRARVMVRTMNLKTIRKPAFKRNDDDIRK